MVQTLIELMDAKGINAAQLSRDTGIPQNTISNWMKRDKCVSLKNAIILSEYFGVPIRSFLNEG